ncbi:hypothetical protein PHIM7_141 [Sinorhizobium phage phiM7]|uniref:Lipoprotein n=3 Tax=Emdodecavirus TaxID=1980937 RepID=S5MD31_9CAUD|nr:hypothetical protein AB690_gp356 [Sinorhizobium phage phiM12]YP_009212395.1 hypothetical protein AVT40_gp378 [Sinorhizobium phage phiN3]YP_009601266.1 hypothetical protein FDH46_gp337 [Sinorhizobium phage phiM7]AKF13046.1 hypothetical protein PHIM19_141 [Sinorhizobium phage phiM19]AGR47839.1 hypothetical protein SmphiM12_207 [Sinorhizobium phage phiM12]AKF12687.1 hypothetical protein PHIM7_141 [Sinorhizobium phage phiM7]AKF13418.1 hypothetical protein PHIN3_155 [Sinorhizobium phage phiN3]
MKKILFILPVVALLAGCGVNPESAARAMEAQGLKDTKITGYAWFGGCSKDDWFTSYFTATGANGAPVSGTVCQGLFKGTTVRFD